MLQATHSAGVARSLSPFELPLNGLQLTKAADQLAISVASSESYLMIFFCPFFDGACIAELPSFSQKGAASHDLGAVRRACGSSRSRKS
ncbi:MAG: hypothetical protein DMG97_26975 [Acidobacteria bacterium]|nr:MAG: hypothetical protein DMG97_26975 [Acidobacteriota bacterium]